jgi:hypothetical protein
LVVELVVAMVKVGGERERTKGSVVWKEKLVGKFGFSPNLDSIFFMLGAWNPPLFIRDGRGTCCL